MTILDRSYEVDEDGFLVDSEQWDEPFAAALAPEHGIPAGLSGEHWQVIRFIRDVFAREGRCPLVHQTCRANHLHLRQLQELFPTGYLRGACRLAGVTYKQGYHGSVAVAHAARPGAPHTAPAPVAPVPSKAYAIDVYGFLIDPSAWDESYACCRAADLKMGDLTDRHWQVLRFLRARFAERGAVPTVYETCDALGLDIDELGRLFPDGYQRGAVKISGLRTF
jgi:tRNA 2-thiouridine synthesizing protein E